MILQSTPVLFVDDIEASEAFFRKLGFRRTVEVPHGDGLGFVILSQGGSEGGDGGIGVMLQTPAAALDDIAGADPALFTGRVHLFMSVADLDAAERAVGPERTRFFDRRTSFYGAHEIGFVEPGGNYVTLAEFAAESADAG